MTGKDIIVNDLIETLDEMLAIIEEQDAIDSDFALIRETAEQLREELVSLQESFFIVQIKQTHKYI